MTTQHQPIPQCSHRFHVKKLALESKQAREEIFKKFFFYFWLCWVFIAARRLSLVTATLMVCGLRIAVASLVAELGL